MRINTLETTPERVPALACILFGVIAMTLPTRNRRVQVGIDRWTS